MQNIRGTGRKDLAGISKQEEQKPSENYLINKEKIKPDRLLSWWPVMSLTMPEIPPGVKLELQQ